MSLYLRSLVRAFCMNIHIFIPSCKAKETSFTLKLNLRASTRPRDIETKTSRDKGREMLADRLTAADSQSKDVL